MGCKMSAMTKPPTAIESKLAKRKIKALAMIKRITTTMLFVEFDHLGELEIVLL